MKWKKIKATYCKLYRPGSWFWKTFRALPKDSKRLEIDKQSDWVTRLTHLTHLNRLIHPSQGFRRVHSVYYAIRTKHAERSKRIVGVERKSNFSLKHLKFTFWTGKHLKRSFSHTRVSNHLSQMAINGFCLKFKRNKKLLKKNKDAFSQRKNSFWAARDRECSNRKKIWHKV